VLALNAPKGTAADVTGRVGPRIRPFQWSGGMAHEIEIEPIEGADLNVRIKAVDWKCDFNAGDTVRIVGKVESVRPWASGGVKYATIELARGNRVSRSTPGDRPARVAAPSMIAPAVNTEPTDPTAIVERDPLAIPSDEPIF